jgi:signal peptidase I
MNRKKFLIALIIVFAIFLFGVYIFQIQTVEMAPGDPDSNMEIQIG